MTWFTVELQVESTHYCRIEAPDRNAAQRWARRARTDVLRSLGELGPEEEYAGVDSVEYSTHKAAGPWAPPAYTDRAAETAPPYQALQATPPTGRNPHPTHKRKQPPPTS